MQLLKAQECATLHVVGIQLAFYNVDYQARVTE
jgi:hypothetical protein